MVMLDEHPIYEQIKRAIKDSIHTGDLSVGAPVPSERELSAAYGVTRGQTRQALRELELEGYVERSQGRRSVVAAPERRARPLIINNRPTLAIAMQDQQTLHTQKILQGFMQSSGASGFQTVAYSLHFDQAGELGFLEQIAGTGASGLAFWPHFDQEASRSALAGLKRSGFPVVLIDRFLEGLDIDAVVTDNIAVGAHLTQALLERGHGRIAFITEEETSSSAQERFEGFRRAHVQHKLSFDPALHCILEDGLDGAAEAVRLLQSRKARPSGYVCAHDRLARAVWLALDELGYNVSKDIEIASVWDDRIAPPEGPPMFVLEQPSVDIGKRAFESLHAQLTTGTHPGVAHRLSPIPDRPVEIQAIARGEGVSEQDVYEPSIPDSCHKNTLNSKET